MRSGASGVIIASYWKTLRELSTLGYTLVWVLVCFPGLRACSDFAGCLRRGDYSGAAGVVTGDLISLVVFYFVIGSIRHLYKLYNSPGK
jgi:hypothetical protein